MAGATQGSMIGEAPADFQRCLALAGAGNYQEELLSTLTALIGYYVPRAECAGLTICSTRCPPG